VFHQRGGLGRTCLQDGPNGSHPTRGVFSSRLVMSFEFILLYHYGRMTMFLSGDRCNVPLFHTMKVYKVSG